MAAAPKGLTQRQAAERLGVSQPYVAKMVREGKLRRLPDSKRIDPDSVEEVRPTLGSRKTDSGAGGKAAPAAIGAPGNLAEQGDRLADAISGVPADWARLSYAEARRLKEIGAAYRSALDTQQAAGLLVERAAVIEEWQEIASHVRERFLGLPVRAATRLGLAPEQKDVLDQLVREVLSEFSADDARH